MVQLGQSVLHVDAYVPDVWRNRPNSGCVVWWREKVFPEFGGIYEFNEGKSGGNWIRSFV